MADGPAAGETARERARRAYFETIAERGPATFMSNAAGLGFRIVEHDGAPVPVLVNEGRPEAASFASPSGHYLRYPIHEIAKASRLWGSGALAAVLAPVALALRACRFDRVAYVGSWLLVGGPRLGLTGKSWRRLVARLREELPDHALIVSGVVPALAPQEMASLRAIGGRPVQSRVAHLLDPAAALNGRAFSTARHNRNADLRLLRAADARRVDGEALASATDRLADLYRRLYISRHAALNPAYTPDFFRLIATSPLFETVGWRRGEELECFCALVVDEGVLSWSTGGYDTSAPQERGLFRLICAEDLEAARRAGAVANLGGGNGAFKRHRGARPVPEFDVVFDGHLPVRRRVAWSALQRFRAVRGRVGEAELSGGGAARRRA